MDSSIQTPPLCRHCGQSCPTGATFCCNGCAGAWRIIHEMGLDSYYRKRTINGEIPAAVPAEMDRFDFESSTRTEENGSACLHLMVEGLHCAACVWLIEQVLGREAGVRAARVNMSTRRLVLKWNPAATDARTLVSAVTRLGYRLVPYDPEALGSADKREEKDLLLCLAVAGFAASNVMLFSVALWAGAQIDPLARTLMQWYSALVVLPASAFAIRPFARSALEGLKHRRITMDVPITLAVVLTLGMSVYESISQRGDTYFEAAASLLFFLLIGRYLDRRVRSKAMSCAEDLNVLQSHAATVIGQDGTPRSVPSRTLRPGDRLMVARGEQISADILVLEGNSMLDRSVVTGEIHPVHVQPGDSVPAGTINLEAPLQAQVTAAGDDSTLGKMARLAENAALAKNRYTRLADRAARYYAPAVHTLALATLTLWWVYTHDFHQALTNAIAVLIVTCPCAIALAVPAVQVAAASVLLRAGILLKRPEALEKLEHIDTVIFDKTGTLTTGAFTLVGEPKKDHLLAAASLAAVSRHPLSAALTQAAGPVPPAAGVRETPGKGLESKDGARLGSAAFCGASGEESGDDIPGSPQTLLFYRPSPSLPDIIRFSFSDTLRRDAAQTVQGFKNVGLRCVLLSGDRPAPVRAMAEAAGIDEWRAEMTPEQKHAELVERQKNGHRVLMIGDGLNDAPALAAAHVSMSPGSAVTLSRNAADIVLQGETIGGSLATFKMAGRAMRAARQNFAIAIVYNIIAVPMAMAGWITPLWAAAFMSASSITVMLNALRIASRKSWMSSFS